MIFVLEDDGRDYFEGFGGGDYVRSTLAKEDRYDCDESGRLFAVRLKWVDRRLYSMSPVGRWLAQAIERHLTSVPSETNKVKPDGNCGETRPPALGTHTTAFCASRSKLEAAMWFVQVVDRQTNLLERELGPRKSRREAEKIERGVNSKLDHDRYYTVLVGLRA